MNQETLAMMVSAAKRVLSEPEPGPGVSSYRREWAADVVRYAEQGDVAAGRRIFIETPPADLVAARLEAAAA